jgi:hypothetical protein
LHGSGAFIGKALLTASLFPGETRRRRTAPQFNAFTLRCFAVNIKLAIFHSGC